MAIMTIRDLDDRLKARLRVRAAQNNRSMEEEVRVILRTALSAEGTRGASLWKAIRSRVQSLGGIDLVSPTREPMRDIDVE